MAVCVQVALPRFTIGSNFKFDNLSWCGYFVTLLAAVYFVVVLVVFDPSRTNTGSKTKPQPVTFPQVGLTSWATVAYQELSVA